MARGLIPVNVISRDGVDDSTVTPTVGDPTNGHRIANTGVMWLRVKNTNAGSTARTVTFHLVGSTDGQGVTSRVESIPAGKTFVMGPWPKDAYGAYLLVDPSHAEITISAWSLTG
jgi:hypothetical protein